ncbi:complex I intermediate-associated protein 30 [Phlyctema vagabunda]|uniref:Complex I intermediate-associated protein 30 n=1 Tax=Phlyctema vagabunda TaxID=108571 RepID=A0ABR4PC17_9HELO
MSSSSLALFGGALPWSPLDWTASDDRVRGGKSQSYLDCDPSSPTAEFHGNLDLTALGTAGFASQRTTGDDRIWDLSAYDGILISVELSDAKQYTLTVKDQVVPAVNGSDRSTISWEHVFSSEATEEPRDAFVPWSSLVATYRGRNLTDPEPLDLKSIKRISLMMRSYFGAQEGNFTMSLRSISASKDPSLLQHEDLVKRYNKGNNKSKDKDKAKGKKKGKGSFGDFLVHTLRKALKPMIALTLGPNKD